MAAESSGAPGGDGRAEPGRSTGARRTAGWWRRRSLRFRLTAVASAVLAVALAVSAHVMMGVLARALLDRTDESLYQRARGVVSLADAGRLPGELTSSDGTLIQVVDAAGRITHATTGTDRLVPLLDARKRAASLTEGRARFLDGEPYGIPHLLRVRVLSADRGQTVIAARVFSEVETSVATAGRVLVVGTPLLLVLLAAVSWVIVGRTLRPIAALRRGAEEITGTARSRRLPVPESRDEVYSLATTLNAMLDRLERADARQRSLVSDAAHELRSPLASIRLQLEVALGHPGGADDWRETAEGVLEDTTRLTRLAEDLLALARLDERGGALARREPVRLDDLVPQTVERYGGAVTVRIAGEGGAAVTVAGDALDLGRVLVNLVDNALRHTVSPVLVELRTEGADAVLTVADDGPGIPEADRERVFDRFTRLDSARSRDEGGAGLGLAIVRETVDAHGGAVHLEDASPGLRAVVRLPLS
ncbi:cell wall metabolism sensor histidine kinase WalK [Planomonospora sp. ID82291]|uniref:sensor histidine kinase n=1 Tax=Planomonospora sp. ID82291 TaxID=2738136 RepID=UPI0018C41C6A|nr:HAMP domain-containing sensor histidine kinase [Planomonospora sp. ID82291]MBG0817766.1 HAMP domain-containing histidine kinase [Planomonospora sp. ID82291]